MAVSLVLERRLPEGPTAPARTERRRVYIFLTRAGAGFTVLLISMLLGAVNYTNSMAYLMTFLLASLFMVSMLHTYRNLRGLVLTLHGADPVFAGDSAHFPLIVDNRRGLERRALRLRPARTPRTGAAPTLPLSLPADHIEKSFFAMPMPQRGLHRLPPLVIESRFPLGLFRAWSYLDTAPACTVYPQPKGSAHLPPDSSLISGYSAGRRPGTDDFSGFAAYRPGDSIRRIDWKALARGHDLMVKRFSGTGSRQLVLGWTDTAGLADLEARLSQLCRWVLAAEQAGLEYGLDMPGSRIPAAQGVQHRHLCLEALALFEGGHR